MKKVWLLILLLLSGFSQTAHCFCTADTTCGGFCTVYADCSSNGSGCDVCVPGFDECGACTSYASNQTNCENAALNGGTCSWNGSCCVQGSGAAAPEMPTSIFVYFAMAIALVVLRLRMPSVKTS